MSWSSSYGGTCSAPSGSGSSSYSSSSSSSSSSSRSSSGGGYTDGWANNTAYTSKGTDTGFSNNGSSATQNGYSGSGSSSYWNGVYGGDKRTNNPEMQKGVYLSTPTAQQYLSDQIASKRASKQEIEAGKSIIAGKEAAQGQGLLSSMLTSAGSATLGPVGWAAGKAAGWLGGKAMDSASEYGDNHNYQVSKDKSNDDSTLVGSLIGFAAPSSIGGVAKTAYNDKNGEYNSYVNGLKSSMVNNGYLSQQQQSTQPSSSSSNQSSSLLKSMQATTPTNTTNTTTNNVDPTDVDWSTFSFYSGTYS